MSKTSFKLRLNPIALLVAVGMMWFLPLSCRRGEKAEKSAPIKVSVITIDTVHSGMVRTYVGEVEEKLSLSLSFATGGKVEKVMVHEGDYVREGQLLVTVNFAVPESEISSLPLGRETSIIIPALNDMVVTGRITEKSITSNPVAHSYQVKINLPNGSRKLLPGMVCKVEVDHPNDEGLVIPANCVQTRPEGLSVWVVRNGKPQRQLIQVSQYVVNGVLVLDGLHQDDTLIVEGQQKLFTGAEIIF